MLFGGGVNCKNITREGLSSHRHPYFLQYEAVYDSRAFHSKSPDNVHALLHRNFFPVIFLFLPQIKR